MGTALAFALLALGVFFIWAGWKDKSPLSEIRGAFK